MNLFFGDKSGFSLQAYIPYRYQKKGQQLAIPSQKKKVVNVLGFLNPLTDQLITYPLPEKTNMNSELFLTFRTNFARQMQQSTVVILDHASWHKSALTKSMFSKWKQQGFYLHFLPPQMPPSKLD